MSGWSKGRAGCSLLKAMSLLVTLSMLLSLLPVPALAQAGAGVAVESITVMAGEAGSLVPAADIEAGGAYTVQVTVQNGGAEEAAGLSVALYVYGAGAAAGTDQGETQAVDSLAPAGTATLDFAWTPPEAGEYDLKAVVTAGGEELDTGDITVTAAEVQETEEDKDIEEEETSGKKGEEAFPPLTEALPNSAPTVVAGQETQTGSATPASEDGTIAAVPYTADAAGWFTDADEDPLACSVVSAAYGTDDAGAAVSIAGGTITYTPAAAQAGKTVTIVVKANDGTADSTGNVTITVTVHAAGGSAAYNGQTDTGSYTISTAEQLALLATVVNAGSTSYSGSTFTLIDDIDLSTVCGADVNGSEVSWTPIGNNPIRRFAGIFDGNGKTISGLYIRSISSYNGLFGSVNGGTVKNLTVGGSISTSGSYTGGIAGNASGAAITNCLSDVALTITGTGRQAGGITGYTVGNGTVTSCVNTGPITNRSSATSYYIGAITGYAYATAITACYSTTEVVTSSSSSVNGAIVTADELKTGKLLWSLNTADGTQAYGNAWTADADGIRLGTGVVYYRVRIMNYSPSIALTFSQEGETVPSYAESGDYNTVYVPAGILTIAPSTMTDFSFEESDGLTRGEDTYTLAVSADTDLSCGLESDYITDNEKRQKITWYTDDPSAASFTISTADQLVGLGLLVSGDITGYDPVDFSGKTIRLGGNIDLLTVCSSELGNWTPIGTETAPFAGTFDGAGYTVRNLYIDSAQDNQGLFGYTNGTISSVTVSGIVTGGSNVGAVAGTSTGTVINCTGLAAVAGSGNVGGVAGAAASISTCIYYKADAAVGVAGSASSAAGCYYLADHAIVGAVGEAKTATEFAAREMAYLLDTVTGSHTNTWQLGEDYPVPGSSTVYKVSIKPEVSQTGKSVEPSSDSVTIYTDGDTQYAYLVSGESLTLNVTSNDPDDTPIFYPGDVVTASDGVYTVSVSSADISLSYRFSKSVSADTSWYNPDSAAFTLTTEAQLRGLATLVNDNGVSFEGKSIKLGNDIALVGGDWPMIGNKTNQFFGTFDGNNHTVSGFYIKVTSTDANIYNYQGFFGYLGSMSTVQNLKLDGTVADGKYFCGLLAGYADPYCTINNCVTNGTVYFTDHTQSRIYAAGMVGDLDQYGIMTGCVNNADVMVNLNTLTVNSTNFGAAGLIGYLDPYGEVTSCVNNGVVSCTVGDYNSHRVSPMLGGIIGNAAQEIQVTDCVNNGAITGSGIVTGSTNQTSIGGIIGSSYTAIISGCRNNGKISGTLADSTSRAYAGGITGGSNSSLTGTNTKYDLTVESCVNNGEVELVCGGASNVALAGGIAGGSGIMLTAIEHCTNTGPVNVACPSGEAVTGTNTGAGGIIGNAFNLNTDAKISKCVNSGTVSAGANYAGGIAGNAGSGLLITDCYNIAAVTGADYVGGVIGRLAGSLQSAFNYGGSVASTSGSNAGMVVGGGAAPANTKGAYYLETTGLTGAETAADAADTAAKTAVEFASSYDLVYALNSVGSTVEDRCVWEQGERYPQFASEEAMPVYEVKAVSGANGTVSRSKQYLSEGESYTITFTPADGFILKHFTVTDMNGSSYQVYLNSVENDTYSVALEDTAGNTYAASFSRNVLTCTMAAHSLTFTGEFTAKATGKATVTLNSNGGWFDNDEEKTTATLSVDAGRLLTLQDLPQPEEYRSFISWYTDAAGTAPFNFSAAITADTILYAKWDENSCVVYYHFNGGSWSSKSYTTVASGTCLAEPAEKPVRKGHTFTGWYGDEACLHPFDFVNTEITNNIDLYAGWVTEGNYQVIFDANGGKFNESATRIQLAFEVGTSIGSALDAHTISNGELILRGWYSAASGGSKWTLSELLTGDRILYAHWDAADGRPTIYPGTAEAPMEIEDLEQLLALRDAVNAGSSYEGDFFKMVNNLTLPADWVPVGALKPGATNGGQGKDIYPFSGTFDGGGNTITVPEDGLPLFGYVREAAIRNLNIYGAKIAGYGLVNNYTVDYGSDGDYNSGAGGSYAPGCPDTVAIDNVTLKSGSSTLYSGLIGGYASGANTVAIRNSTIESGVVIGYEKSSSSIGSFAGQFNGTVENCVSYATVYGLNYVGGIIGGKGQSIGPCKASNSIFAGTIVSTGNYAGGIIGGGYYSSSAPNSPCVSVQNCYVTGSITGLNYVGGILGAEPVVTQCWANGTGYIQNNYFSGTITATADSAAAGGIIGFMKSLDRYNIIENNYYLGTSAPTGIGAIEAIDYETASYGRSEPFVADDVCVPTTADEFASGRIAALLNSGNNSSGIWTQSGNYPAYGNAATATYTATLNTVGSGTASLTGLTTDSVAVYQNAGGTVTVSGTAAEGNNLVRINVVYADGTATNITGSKEFTMPQQNAAVYVVFAEAGEKYVESIVVATMPDKTSYSIGDSFDGTGLTFTVTYSDGSTETIAATADMVSGFSSTSAGTKTLTLTYLGCVTTFTVQVVSGGGGEPDYITVRFSLLGTEADGEEGTVNTLKAGNLTTWISATAVQVARGSTIGDVFAKVLDANGYSYVGLSNNYISSITTPNGLTLAEFTNGPLSGWMYMLNGTHPLYGLNEQKVADGDVIVWHYTDDYTQEKGSEKWNSGGSGNTSPGATSGATVTPKVTAANGAAAIKLSASDLTSAIAYAKEKGSAAVVIRPAITGEAKKVSLELPQSSLSDLVAATDADLTIETSVGSITIPNSALNSIASQASGNTVTVSLEAVDNSSLTEEQQKAVGDNPVYDISIRSGGVNISSFGGGSLTISLPYTLQDGEDPASVTVWYLSDAGQLEQMPCTYDPETGLAAFTTDHLSYYVVGYAEYVEEAPVWTNPFTDVEPADWFYDHVAFAVQKGLFSGTSATTFSPNEPMTRAMLVTVLYRLEGEPSVTGANSFTDVKSGQWYTDAVLWANAEGIVAGYGSGLFGTNDNVTRQQMAAILYRYASHKGYDLTATTDLAAYSDAPEVSDWARSAMQWANAGGLITGRTASTLAPEGSATRAEVAAILMRFVEGFVE